MQTVGPVFIGTGKEILKKEYIYLNQKKIGIPDTYRLYRELRKRGKAEAFERYLLGKENLDLTKWLQKQKIHIADIRPSIKYTLDCGDTITEKGSGQLHIMECIKDAYEKPYIPGSSLKGMFRTILLGADILTDPEKYGSAKENMLRDSALNMGRTAYLKKNIAQVESIAYRTLTRDEKRPDAAVNDILQGLVVSDSEPLPTDSLVLCQKVDRHTDGTEKYLPILRECIKPETTIRFTLTIDTSICGLTGKNLMAAVKRFMTSYYNNFSKTFTGLDIPRGNHVLCGGGCGFVSKTIIYPMYRKETGLRMTQRIFEKTNVPRMHKHDMDKKYGASPHIIKCTKYQGKTYQMGMCKIEKIKRL